MIRWNGSHDDRCLCLNLHFLKYVTLQGGPKFDRRVSHLNLCHTIQCHTPQSITQSIISEIELSHAVRGGTMRSTAVIQSQMKKMIHEIPESCWNRNSRSVPNQFHHSSGNQNNDYELKTFQ